MLLYGREKIGKTSLCQHFEDALFLFTEPGNKDMNLYQMTIDDWAGLKSVVQKLEREKGRFKTIVVDVVDRIWDYCEKYICEKLVISDLTEEDFGKGWRKARHEFLNVISRLLKCNAGVIFISHDAFKEIKMSDGTETDRIIPTMSKSARGVLEPIIDIWAYYCYEKGKRVLYVKGNDLVSAGVRSETHFVGVDKISMGNSSREAYENYIAAFKNERRGDEPIRKIVKR